jgi:hypothetical protein
LILQARRLCFGVGERTEDGKRKERIIMEEKEKRDLLQRRQKKIQRRNNGLKNCSGVVLLFEYLTIYILYNKLSRIIVFKIIISII